MLQYIKKLWLSTYMVFAFKKIYNLGIYDFVFLLNTDNIYDIIILSCLWL